MALFHTTVLDNQIKALDTIGTASGSIATFDTDRAENLINLEVAITATGGGGTPVSPIAINGFSSGVITRCGKNLFDYTQLTSASGWTESGGVYSGTIAQLYAYAKYGFPIQPKWATNQQYVFKLKVNNADGYAVIRFVYTDNTYSDLTIRPFNAGNYVSVITANNKTVSNLLFTYYTGGNLSISEMCLELGDTATNFEAYNGNTYTFAFGQTVYGGRLNVGSGVLTVTDSYVDLGSLSYYHLTGDNSDVAYTLDLSTVMVIPPISEVADCLCSDYAVDKLNNWHNSNTLTAGYVFASNAVNICDSAFVGKTLTEISTYLIGKQLVYKLVTPIEIQLDSKQIQTIANSVNNIYADTGDIIDLKFILTVGQAIS